MTASPFVCHARIADACLSHILLLQTSVDKTMFFLQTLDKVSDLTAQLDIRTGNYKCPCADYRLHMNPCKHLYWLALKYFRAPVPDPTKCLRWDEFLATVPPLPKVEELSAEKKTEIVEILKNTAQRLSTRFAAAAVPPRIDENSDCGICLSSIITWPVQRIHWCRYGCGAAVHESCGSQLRDKTCPSCRAPNFYVNKKRYRADNSGDDDSD